MATLPTLFVPPFKTKTRTEKHFMKTKRNKKSGHKAITPKKNPTIADSLGQAGSMLGLPVRLLQTAKAAGCPGFRGGRVYLIEVQEWLAKPENLAVLKAQSIELEKVELDIAKEKLRLIRHRADLATQQVIPVGDVRESFLRAILAAKSRWFAAETNVTMLASVDLQLSAEQATKLREILAHEIRESLLELSRCKWASETLLCDRCKAAVPITEPATCKAK